MTVPVTSTPSSVATSPAILPSRSARYRRVIEGLHIRDEYGRIKQLKFSESQEILWKHTSPRLDSGAKMWFIVLKGRQVYATTYFESLIFTRTMEHPGTHSLILAQDIDSSGEIFSMAKRFYDFLPMPKMKPSKVKELEFPFPGGTSKFKVVTAGAIAKGRGTTQTCVHASEVAFWPHPEVLSGLFQAMPDVPNTIWVLESTANGMRGNGEVFYNEWNRAISGESDLVPIFIPWWKMSKYRRRPGLNSEDYNDEEKILVKTFNLDGEQLAWRRYAILTKTQASVELFHQEYPSTPEEAFVSTGLPAFDPLAVMAQRPNICLPKERGYMFQGKFHANPKGELRIWERPEEGKRYIIGADTSEGLEGGDYACAQIINMRTLEQVASIHGSVPPWDFALLLNQVGRWYNRAMLAVEVNGTGHAVQDPLIRVYHYPNLHPWMGMPDAVRRGRPRVWGWQTNTHSRPLMIEAGRRAINDRLVVIRDEKTLSEIHNFTRMDNGKYEAEAGHDDRVMALLIALRSREENFFEARPAPQISEPDNLGVRVVDQIEPSLSAARKTSKILREKAKEAVKNWLEM